jgi:hypothetical protein
MGCCSPNYRKTVNEKEEQVNNQGKEKLPFSAKILIVLVTAGALATIILTY